jgi:ribA/ribD-fused uncharacterized protein
MKITPPELAQAESFRRGMLTYKETTTHVYFYRSLWSQWYPSRFISDEQEFNCAEQGMMHTKALWFNDEKSAEDILRSDSPRQMQLIGRSVKNFDPNVWARHRVGIVTVINIAKFQQNPDLKEVMSETRNKILVEGSPFDKIWGVGLGWDDPLILDERHWKGLNLLGKCLMSARKLVL